MFQSTWLLLLMLCIGRGVWAQSGEGAQHFKTAVTLYQRGMWFDAEEAFRRAHQKMPDNSQAAHGVAMCLVNTKRYSAALEWFEKAEFGAKPEAQFFNNHASALDELGRTEDAKKLFEACLAKDAKFVAALYGLGRIQARLGERDAGRKNLGRAVELDPKHTDAAYELADLERRDGKFLEAEKAARKILASFPRHAATRFLLARVCMKLGKQSEGEQLLNEARRIQAEEDAKALAKKKAESYVELGFAALRAQKAAEGVAYMSLALAAEPTNVEARSALADIENRLRSDGRIAEADAVKKTLDKAQ